MPTTSCPPAPAYLSRAWLTVALLWVVALLNYLDRLMITSMREPLKADIAMTDAQFGLLTSVFLWSYGFFSPLGGFLADRFSRRGVIFWSLFLWSAATWFTAHVHSVEGLLVMRAMLGVSQACYIPGALALIADLHPGPTRSLATGLHISGVYAGTALSGMGGMISEHFGWRAGFDWFGLFGVGYAVVLVFLLRNAPPQATEVATGTVERSAPPGGVRAAEAARALFRSPAFLVLLGCNAIIGVANWGIYGWLPTHMREHFKLGLGAAGLTATGYIQVASFLGVVVGGTWADRWSRTQPRARALVPAIGYSIAAPCLFFSIAGDLLPVAIGGLMVYGMARGFFDSNLMPVVRTVVDERYSATAYGWLNFIGVMTGGALIYVGGWLKDIQVPLVYIFQGSAAGLLFVAFLLFTVRRRREPAP